MQKDIEDHIERKIRIVEEKKLMTKLVESLFQENLISLDEKIRVIQLIRESDAL